MEPEAVEALPLGKVIVAVMDVDIRKYERNVSVPAAGATPLPLNPLLVDQL